MKVSKNETEKYCQETSGHTQCDWEVTSITGTCATYTAGEMPKMEGARQPQRAAVCCKIPAGQTEHIEVVWKRRWVWEVKQRVP